MEAFAFYRKLEILTAVRQDGFALRFAAEDLHADTEGVWRARCRRVDLFFQKPANMLSKVSFHFRSALIRLERTATIDAANEIVTSKKGPRGM